MFSDYTQLGLPFSLFLPEIHFNAALCHIKRGDVTRGMYELRKASTRKITPAHEIIEEAIEKRGEGFTVYSIVSHHSSKSSSRDDHRPFCLSYSWYEQPVGLLFRPSENKLKNLAPKDYKGKAVRPRVLLHVQSQTLKLAIRNDLETDSGSFD